MVAELTQLKELVADLRSRNVLYSVFAGFGLDGRRGRLTRQHGDIDIFCLLKDLYKIRRTMRKLGYFFVEQVNDIYKFHKSGGIGVEFCMLTEKSDTVNTRRRFVRLSFPKELFYVTQTGRLESLRFNIACDEILKFCGMSSKKGDDSTFAKTLQCDEALFKAIRETKIP